MPPQYSTVGDASSTKTISGWKKMRIAQRKNQQLIMLNPEKATVDLSSVKIAALRCLR